MTRISKQGRRRATSPRKHKAPSRKTGPKKENLPKGYKPHENAVQVAGVYIPKMKG